MLVWISQTRVCLHIAPKWVKITRNFNTSRKSLPKCTPRPAYTHPLRGPPPHAWSCQNYATVGVTAGVIASPSKQAKRGRKRKSLSSQRREFVRHPPCSVAPVRISSDIIIINSLSSSSFRGEACCVPQSVRHPVRESVLTPRALASSVIVFRGGGEIRLPFRVYGGESASPSREEKVVPPGLMAWTK